MEKAKLEEINNLTEQLLEKLCSPYATDFLEFMKIGYFDWTFVSSFKASDFELKYKDNFDDNYKYAIRNLRALDLIEYSEEGNQKKILATPKGFRVYLSGGWINYVVQLDKETEDRRALLDMQRRYFKWPLLISGLALIFAVITLLDRLICG